VTTVGANRQITLLDILIPGQVFAQQTRPSFVQKMKSVAIA
jgi:hypothetical protein